MKNIDAPPFFLTPVEIIGGIALLVLLFIAIILPLRNGVV